MSALGLDVTKLTRNNVDKNIDWDMLEYFPDLPERLTRWQNELDEIMDVLRALYGFKRMRKLYRKLKLHEQKLKLFPKILMNCHGV